MRNGFLCVRVDLDNYCSGPLRHRHKRCGRIDNGRSSRDQQHVGRADHLLSIIPDVAGQSLPEPDHARPKQRPAVAARRLVRQRNALIVRLEIADHASDGPYAPVDFHHVPRARVRAPRHRSTDRHGWILDWMRVQLDFAGTGVPRRRSGAASRTVRGWRGSVARDMSAMVDYMGCHTS